VDKRNVMLELRLIREKLSKRILIAETLSKSAWNPMKVELPPGERFLILAPHPDDDAIGCGGTILKALAMRKTVRICYLSLPSLNTNSKQERLKEVKNSLKELGVTDHTINKQEFPRTAKLVQEAIEPELKDWKPDCVFVPSPLENQDQHLMTFGSYVEAMRNSPCHAATAFYEVWNPVIPNMVVDVSSFIDKKSKSIAAHTSQVRTIDYVRMARALNEYRAISSNLEGYAEAFLYLEKEDLLKIFH
jgi:LmbE family N-acetylglucosaminyl deacetylase